jgi:hypothetical protein
MASSGFLTITGEGRTAIAFTAYVKETVGRVSVLGQTQVLGTTSPKRLMHAGWFGYGYFNQTLDGVTLSTVTWWKYIDMDGWDIILPTSIVFGDSIFYKMGAGVTARIDTFW